jgi:peptide/nickel transport system ATP-binding protein
MMQQSPLLEVDHLSVRFLRDRQETIAVDDISFRIGKKEIVGIVGESGSGKSVTALAILGLLGSFPGSVTAAAVVFHDTSQGAVRLDKLSEKELQAIRGKSVSMVFQEPMTSLNPVFTCGMQVAETLRAHMNLSRREAKKITLDLFGEVRLPEPGRIFRAYPHQLSGGQRQRVMIAMAISCNPQLLIADEPTTALDVSVQKTVLELLGKLQMLREMSVIFITHDIGLVSGFADRVMVMYRGRIVEQGPVASVFAAPQHPYTRGLLACRPPLKARPRQLPTIGRFLQGEEMRPGGEEQSQGERFISTRERKEIHEKIYSGEPVLTVTDIGKSFPSQKSFLSSGKQDKPVIEHLSFHVYPGETLGIVGESGSGKTTLARAALMLIPPDQGHIFYKSEDITQLPAITLKRLRKEIQIIFQDPYSSLNPRMTVGAALMEPMKVHRMYGSRALRREHTLDLLEKVGLDPVFFHRYPHELSGGQRQRICIARALAVNPRLIICDEAVSALDVSIQAQVLNLLNTLKREFRLTYIFISHDLAVVKYMSDRILVIREGKIIEAGDPDILFENPQTEYTRLLIGSVQ